MQIHTYIHVCAEPVSGTLGNLFLHISNAYEHTSTLVYVYVCVCVDLVLICAT